MTILLGVHKRTTIHLSNHPPVEIVEDEWPVIARHVWFDGPTPKESSERAYVRVRQNRDGRTIVYGLRTGRGHEVMAGYLIQATPTLAEETARAINETSAVVGIEPMEVFSTMPTVSL